MILHQVELFTKTMAGIEDVWKNFAPQYNFQYRFLDDSLDSLYRSELRIGKISYREMTKWVLVANIIAWPVAYLGASKWLQSYAYRINVGILPFVSAALLTFLIAMLTVSYQSIRSARSNPADALRYE